MTAPAVDLPTEPIDVRLVVTDLDGTLLDGDGRIPDRLWSLLGDLRSRGITLAPASGRQYPALRRLFAPSPEGLAFIAENGTYVVRDGVELSSRTLDRTFVEQVITTVRGLAEGGRDLGLVLCGRDVAHIERADERFVAGVGTYYAALTVVDDLLASTIEPIKFAVLDFDGTGHSARVLAEVCAPHQVVPSSPNWIDIMSEGVNKGVALEVLQNRLGVTPEQTVVFGDYLNDLEMITASPYSFAMANAHPDVLAAARFVAPANTEQGVLVVLDELLAASAGR